MSKSNQATDFQCKQNFWSLLNTNLNSLVSPLNNEVSVDLYGELSVINLEDLKVVQTNLNFSRRFSRRIEGRIELAVVGWNTEHVVNGAVLSVPLQVTGEERSCKSFQIKS